MSVIMTMKLNGDPRRVEEIAAQDPERMRSIAERAKDNGVMAHRFYGSEDGTILVVDEWPDPESFQRFFEAERPQIEPLMQEAGISGEPEITFWRKLETNDEVGWD
jgi:hypothetical protein